MDEVESVVGGTSEKEVVEEKMMRGSLLRQDQRAAKLNQTCSCCNGLAFEPQARDISYHHYIQKVKKSMLGSDQISSESIQMTIIIA